MILQLLYHSEFSHKIVPAIPKKSLLFGTHNICFGSEIQKFQVMHCKEPHQA